MTDQWQQGWQDGYDFILKNFNPKTGCKVKRPDNVNNGFYEGEMYGRSVVWDKAYPNHKSISWNSETKQYDVTY